MRLPIRIVAALLLAVSGATCTDGPTGPASGAKRASLALVPQFTAAAAASYNAFTDAGVIVDRVRVVLVRPPADTLKDTTAVFAVGDTTLELNITLPVAPGTVLNASLEFLSGTLVVYAGSGTVTALIPNGPAGPPAVIPVGPKLGATATRLAITPHGGTFTSTAAVPITAQVFDANNAVLSSAVVSWTSSDPTVATVSSTGVLTFTGKGGSSDVTATSPPTMVSDHAVFTFVPPPPPPARLRFDVQPPASTLALDPMTPAIVVSVVDTAGNVVTSATNSITLTLAGGTAGATLGGTRTVSAVNGRATFSGLSVDRAGTGYQLSASSAGLAGATSSTFTITQLAPVAARLRFDVQPPASTPALEPMSPAIVVSLVDSAGNIVTSATNSVTLTLGGGTTGAVLGGTRTVAASNGRATFSGLSVDRAGVGYTLGATATGLAGAASSSFTITQPVPASVSISPAGGTLTALGELLALSATVRDRNGNVLATVVPTWTSRAPAIAPIDSTGSVRAVANGSAYMVAQAGSASDSVLVTVRQQVDTIFMSRDTLRLAFNDTATLVATALDRNRNVIADAAPTFTSADPTIATVTASGLVQLVKSGTTTVTASAGGKSASTVVMQGTAGSGITAAFAYLRITPGGGSVRLGSTTTLVAEYVDASGSATVVTPQWASSQPGRAPVSASGVMTTNDTGTVEITATRNGVTGHATFTILPAPVLTSFSFSPGTVSGVSTNTVKLGVTFGASDPGSGIASVGVTFTGPGGATASCSASAPTSGPSTRGFWDCTLALPAGSPSGTWRATSVVLAGSITRSYDSTQLASFGSTTLTVNP